MHLIQSLLLLGMISQDSDRGDKFVELMKQPSGFQCDYRLEVDGVTVASGYFARKLPQSLEFTAKSATFSYKYVLTPTRATELDLLTKEYYEFGPIQGMLLPTGSFSEIPMRAVASPLQTGSFEKILKSRKLEYTAQGESVIESISVVHYKIKGEGTVDAWFASDGRLVRYDQPLVQADGSVIKFQFYFKNHSSEPTAKFDPEPPNGFVPAALSRPLWPIEIGLPFPKEGWEDSRGTPTKLSFDKPTLIVVVQENCESSGMIKPFLDLAKANVRLVSVSPNGKVPFGLNFEMKLIGSSGSLFDRIGIQGTPTFLLVGKDGKIKWLDVGYQKGSEKRVLADMLAKLNAKS